jgi:flagellar hook-associated protein 3 FlgL
MRIATALGYQAAITNLQTRQEQLSEAQERLSSGKRVARASDDPSAAARAERALATVTRSEAGQRALEASRTAMQLTDTALGDAGELLQQAREHVVAAGNASYSDAERRTLAAALRGLRTQLLAVANRSDGAGNHLFGGQGSTSAPFVDAPGGVQYVGTTGTMRAATDIELPVSIDGQVVWLQAPNPSGPPISVFDVLDRTIADLETAGRTSAQIDTGVRASLGELDAAAGNLLAWRARTGESLHRADSLEDRLADVKLEAQHERSRAEDLDMVQAISEFQSRQTGYDAALKTYSMVQRMSLFDYLRS